MHPTLVFRQNFSNIQGAHTTAEPKDHPTAPVKKYLDQEIQNLHFVASQIYLCCEGIHQYHFTYFVHPHNRKTDNAMTPSLYQVGFVEESIARVNKGSKIRVTWTFRVASSPSDAAQGREHSISLIWSKKTGKQEIFMDGTEEVFFGRHRGASVFDHQWETQSEGLPLQLQILATCAPKLHPGFRCYDLIINGNVFAYLPHYGDHGPTPAIMAESPIVDGRPGSIFDIIFPNEKVIGSPFGVEERQPEPEPQPPQQVHPTVEEDVVMSEPRFEPEPIDLLSQ
jgi:hypothetical protein